MKSMVIWSFSSTLPSGFSSFHSVWGVFSHFLPGFIHSRNRRERQKIAMATPMATVKIAGARARLTIFGGRSWLPLPSTSQLHVVARRTFPPLRESINHGDNPSSPAHKRGRVAQFFPLSFGAASATHTEATGEASVGENTALKDSLSEDENQDVKVKDAANMLDIRVGRIVRAWRHEEAESLYVEEVDVGEPEPRLICSGLVNYVPLDQLQDASVIVLANLKPRNMRGVKSCGMLMAASDKSHENVELLQPPSASLPGERIWFGSEDEKEKQPPAATPNQIQKKKTWEMVQPYLKTDADCVAMLGMHAMRTSNGVVTCKSLKNANIS